MLVEQINESVQAVLQELAQSESYRAYFGEYSTQLVEALSAQHGDAGVLLTSSGTAALEISLRAAGIGPGDEVIISAYDYPGNFWAIERCGARPLLVDIEPNGWLISRHDLDAVIETGGAPQAVVVSHLHGQMQPMLELRGWCENLGLLLIEDTCQAIGASVADVPSGTMGHFGIASFGGGKVLSAGRGGCIVSESEILIQKARVAAGVGSGPYCMSEMQAAVVLAQLPWLPAINDTCRAFFAQLASHLLDRGCSHVFPAQAGMETSAFYQAGWISPDMNLEQRDQLIGRLRDRGIAAGSGFSGFHRRSSRRCRTAGNLANTVAAVDQTWVIHHSQALAGHLSVEEVADAIVAATSLA